MPRLKILISGGGIAGLTAALALAKFNHRIEIYECAETIEPLGAGIQISPNAFHVLKSLELDEEIIKLSGVPNAIIMMNAIKGTKLTSLPLGFDIQDKYHAPYLVIHRADLHTVLLEKCKLHPDININFSSELIDAAMHRNGVTVLIKSTDVISEHLGDILIGSDGVHSNVRSRVLELDAPKYTGKVAWRGLIAQEHIRSAELMTNTKGWLSPKAHAVTYPIRNGAFLNVVIVTQDNKEKNKKVISNQTLKEQFSHWSEEFTSLLDHEPDWTGWPLYETASPRKMVEGKIALIGDAAHTMLPFAAQGAAQAIEDAHVLAKCLDEDNNLEDALKTFEKIRLPRVRKVIKAARNNGRIYHLSAPFSNMRNLAFKMIPAQRLLQKQDWIYRWRP